MPGCLFCEIAAKNARADIVAETPDCVAFRDIRPQAPTHILVIPRKHVATLNDLEDADRGLVGKMFLLARDLARREGIDQAGWRAVFNTNAQAGQTVFHIHLHVLGGRAMKWPPG